MTIFQRIIAREIPAEILHEDEKCVAVRDINPQAPVHVLVVPKEVLVRIGEAEGDHEALLGHLLLVAASVGGREAPGGYRIVINNGRDGGETVPHLHVHILGGRPMGWPPG